jgi:hypothetical protein
LGVRIRTLREGRGVGEESRFGEVWVEEEGMGGGDGVLSLGGGGGGGETDGSVDMRASGTVSNDGRTPLSLFRSDPPAGAAPAGTGGASPTSKCVADEAKFGDNCRISSIDLMTPLPLGAASSCAFSFCPFSPSV